MVPARAEQAQRKLVEAWVPSLLLLEPAIPMPQQAVLQPPALRVASRKWRNEVPLALLLPERSLPALPLLLLRQVALQPPAQRAA